MSTSALASPVTASTALNRMDQGAAFTVGASHIGKYVRQTAAAAIPTLGIMPAMALNETVIIRNTTGAKINTALASGVTCLGDRNIDTLKTATFVVVATDGSTTTQYECIGGVA
jgi:hypothetical protein